MNGHTEMVQTIHQVELGNGTHLVLNFNPIQLLPVLHTRVYFSLHQFHIGFLLFEIKKAFKAVTEIESHHISLCAITFRIGFEFQHRLFNVGIVNFRTVAMSVLVSLFATVEHKIIGISVYLEMDRFTGLEFCGFVEGDIVVHIRYYVLAARAEQKKEED